MTDDRCSLILEDGAITVVGGARIGWARTLARTLFAQAVETCHGKISGGSSPGLSKSQSWTAGMMAATNVESNVSRLTDETRIMESHKPYGLPDSYNPADYPPVRMRSNNADRSETQRKRRSKNRLSNRRSTGFISKDLVDEAMKMGSSNTPNDQ